VLETLSSIRTVAFDKTGTLTTGAPHVTDFVVFHGDKERAVGIAAALEAQSEHPLAQAVVAYARESGMSTRLAISNAEEHGGLGLRAHIDGEVYQIGRATQWPALSSQVLSTLQQLEEAGRSVALLGTATEVHAAIGFA
jgi:P-type E1-E2 ATPase